MKGEMGEIRKWKKIIGNLRKCESEKMRKWVDEKLKVRRRMKIEWRQSMRSSQKIMPKIQENFKKCIYLNEDRDHKQNYSNPVTVYD